jgi:uncharacterized protein (DUF58 family)
MAGSRQADDRRATADRSGLASARPTLRGIVALACLVILGVVETLSGRSGLYPFLVVVALPLCAAPVLVRSRGRRAVGAQVRTIVTPPLVAVGESCELAVQLYNESDRTLPPLNLDWPPDHFRSGTSVPVHQLLAVDPGRLIRWAPLGAGGNSSTSLTLPTARRGVFTVGPLRLWVHDPFGLLASPVAAAAPVTLVVHPLRAPSSLRVLPSDVADHATTTGVRTVDTVDDDPGGELSGLRPYVPGDRLHLLSWPVEARYGALMVQQFRPEGNALIRIVLDDRAGVHRRQAFERALSILHALASEAIESSLDVEITTLSGERARLVSTPEGIVDLLSFLARVVPRPLRAMGNEAAWQSIPPRAATIVTTATARATLPRLPDDLSVVVLE